MGMGWCSGSQRNRNGNTGDTAICAVFLQKQIRSRKKKAGLTMFHKKNFCHVSSTNRGCPQYSIYVYKTTDSVETMLTEGYFNEALLDLQKNDVIAAAIISETDNTEYERVYFRVTQRTLDSVSVEQIITDASDISFDGTGTVYIENAKNIQEALDGLDAAVDTKVSKSGDTMTGPLKFVKGNNSVEFSFSSLGSLSISFNNGSTTWYLRENSFASNSLSDELSLGTNSQPFPIIYAQSIGQHFSTLINIPNVAGTLTLNEVNFQTPITDTNKGATMKEIIDIQNTSIKFKGFVSTTEPSSSEFTLFEGNMWINASAMPSSFPVPATSIRVWDGTAWQTTTDSYTPAPLDAWRNENDNQGYYWFGGVWTVMSTDLSPDYFVLDPTDGKWNIKDSVNLPGNPTTTTPTTGDSSTKIATTAFVQEAVSNAGDYVIYWDSADATDHSHAKPGVSTPVNHGWYRYYKSGWCEQGGHSGGPDKTIILPVPMLDTNYGILTDIVGTFGYDALRWAVGNITYAGFRCFYIGDPTTPTEFYWHVEGYAA